jgi:3-dehydroquinate synthase
MENSKKSEIIFTRRLSDDLLPFMESYRNGELFLATETTVNELWIRKTAVLKDLPAVILPSGETHKQLDSVAAIWKFLSDNGADRHSLLINTGGGMLTDLAGFAASTFKRGIGFVNIPTTLLSQVDASVGGKTGFNFNGLKNEIGTFCNPRAVLIHTPFLETLDRENMLSGFAEMIKHGLIHDRAHLSELEAYNINRPDLHALAGMIRHSVDIKKYFVDNDPHEKSVRKALNFGHTTGHAIESLAMDQGKPVLHGYAVAWGMVAELFLSTLKCGFPDTEMVRIATWIKNLYGDFPLGRSDFQKMEELMKHDKKNEESRINFTLLSGTGHFVINQYCESLAISEALEFLNQL